LNAMYGTIPAGCWFTDVDWTMLTPQQRYPLYASYDPCLSPSDMNIYFSNTHNQAVSKTPSGKDYYYLTMYAYEDLFYYHQAKYRYGTLNYPLEL